MSAAAAYGGAGGMDGDDDKKRKRAMPEDAPDLPSRSSDASDSENEDESAPIDQKQKGVSSHWLKKRRVDHRKFQNALTKVAEAERVVAAASERLAVIFEQPSDEALRRLKEAVRRVSSARIGSSEVARVADLLDQEAGSSDGEDTKDDAGKSEGGASGYQSDHSMTGAGSSDDNAEDDIVRGFSTDDEEYGGKNY